MKQQKTDNTDKKKAPVKPTNRRVLSGGESGHKVRFGQLLDDAVLGVKKK